MMQLDLYLLGAGQPKTGVVPSALKNITYYKKALDWQLDSFSDVVTEQHIHFLGGYHMDNVMASYPALNFIAAPSWAQTTVLDTLFQAQFSGHPILISYTDTLFRRDYIRDFLNHHTDIHVSIDSQWRQRYQSRSQHDMLQAEKIWLDNQQVEFTGLVYFSQKAIHLLQQWLREQPQEVAQLSDIPELIRLLEQQGLTVAYSDVQGDWAEFNAPNDITHFILGTKADTLARLEPMVQNSLIGEQVCFTAQAWQSSPSHVIEGIQAKFGDIKLIVRSSSSAEYNWRSSNAGGFESILNVACLDEHELHQAIQTVMDSYGEAQQDHDQVLIQSCLQDVSMSGVVFTCTLESGAPYYRFNFDDKTGSTESVTTGVQLDLRTVLVSKLQPQALKQTAPELQPVLDAVQELEQLLAFDKLDIEFAVDQQGQVHIFQVRPVVVNHESYDINIEQIQQSIEQDVIRFHGLQPKRADISGDKTLFANMPDWNPAEIIGTKPKPLAFSLYQQLITNRIWAQQRAEYGYRDVRPYPLICSFSGQPYVDVRASFNSFLPAMLPQDTADRLVNAYLNLLSDQPHLHDKVEFDVVLTVWTPDLMTTAQHRLFPYGVTQQDLVLLEQGLKQITCSALTRLESDIASVQSLKSRRDAISQSQCATIDKIYALLDDCKRFGTLAFAHAARAGFVASTILNYLVQSGALTASRRLQFLSSFDTVAGEFERDKAAVLSSTMTREELVQKYGHLRPGTYDVTAQAYWEDPEKYLFPKEMKSVPEPSICFAFSNDERFAMHSFLEQLNSAVDVDQFIQYLIHATQERERVKFEFTKNLSLALDYAVILGQEWGLSRDQMAFMTYSDIERLKLGMMDRAELCCSLEKRANRYLVSKVIELPALIDDETQFYSYERCTSQPNFLGVQNVVADLVLLADKNPVDLSGKIVLIQQADPGYDWLFGENIAGLITQYGGANSHMAIRAAEMGLPAAIGVGEKLYDTLLIATSLELDCLGQTIRIVK